MTSELGIGIVNSMFELALIAFWGKSFFNINYIIVQSQLSQTSKHRVDWSQRLDNRGYIQPGKVHIDTGFRTAAKLSEGQIDRSPTTSTDVETHRIGVREIKPI